MSSRDKFIDDERLRRYRVLVLPNMACIADASAQAIERFTMAGGSIVSTFDTASRTVDGAVRSQPALGKVLGVTVKGRREDLKSSYARIESGNDPLTAGLGDTDIIPNEGALVEVDTDADRTVVLTLIPPVIAHSGATISIPEYSAIRATTRIPLAVRGTFGKGRTVYFANPMGRTSFIATVFRISAAFSRTPCATRSATMPLSKSMHLSSSTFIHGTAPAQTRTSHQLPGCQTAQYRMAPCRSHARAGRGIVVRLKLSPHERLREVRIASTEDALASTELNGWIAVTVPRLKDHDIVVFELAPDGGRS